MYLEEQVSWRHGLCAESGYGEEGGGGRNAREYDLLGQTLLGEGEALRELVVPLVHASGATTCSSNRAGLFADGRAQRLRWASV